VRQQGTSGTCQRPDRRPVLAASKGWLGGRISHAADNRKPARLREFLRPALLFKMVLRFRKPSERQDRSAMSNLVNELKRNAAYYSAGADREAGDLLARAAEALSAPSVGALYRIDASRLCRPFRQLRARRRHGYREGTPTGAGWLPFSDNCRRQGARIRSPLSPRAKVGLTAGG
jgi:hypothetical protein